MDKDLTSFCGLWCNDCIPGNEKLYALASELYQLLMDIDFKDYVKLKSQKVAEFSSGSTVCRHKKCLKPLQHMG